MNLEVSRIFITFPSDTIWFSSGAELIGYSYAKNIHIVIQDGMCYSYNNKWYVHIYKVPEKVVYDNLLLPHRVKAHTMGNDVWHYYDTYFVGFKPKWPPENCNNEKIFEDWIDFNDPHLLDIDSMNIIK